MASKRLKIVALVVILILNVVFAYLLISRKNSASTYSKEEINNLQLILQDGNLSVPTQLF